ncbi:MAG: tetratricopeptide repeat protein [Pseudomonadota bacterium]|nr:tetratricopeptide repeat protein [Pseudomonadota bacterium]
MQLKQRKSTASATVPSTPSSSGAERCWHKGVAHAEASDWPRAEKAFAEAVSARPDDALYLNNLARAQLRNERYEAALETARRVLRADPEDTLARQIAAECLNKQHRYVEAVACLSEQPESLPRSTEFHQSLSEALFNAGMHREAIGVLFEALNGNMAHAMSHYRLGVSFNSLGMKAEATECLRTALILGMGPGDLGTQGLLTFIERELCRWDHAAQDLAALRRIVQALPPEATQWAAVFANVTLTDDPAEHLRAARSCVRFTTREVKPLPAVPRRPLGQRLKVGFVSSDFHMHATAVLMAEVFEKIDRSRFEVTLYSHGPEDGTEMRQRLKRTAEHFIQVDTLSDLEVAQHVRASGTDLLIDLKGHTRDSRLGILAHRPAPVQATYLGFPGTTGADFIDYFIGDEVVSPLTHAPFYSEKLALLPRCYQPNDRQRPRPKPTHRAAVGLPETGLVLCGFNQPFKLSPEVFDVWCGLLLQIPDAVLWLLQWNDQAPRQLRQEAAARGVDPARLVFAPKVGLGEHISRLALADLFLDTWPCNGHTTASDALWAGLPVVTYAGAAFPARVAASLLGAVGLPQLACETLAAYERLVLDLASDIPRRTALRAHLVQARDTAPLFDSTGYTRDFEALMWTLAERRSRGLPPDHLRSPSAAPSTPGVTTP